MLTLTAPIDRVEKFLYNSSKYLSVERVKNFEGNIYGGDTLLTVTHRNKDLDNSMVRSEFHFDKKGRLRLVRSKATIRGKEYVCETPLDLSWTQRLADKLLGVLKR